MTNFVFLKVSSLFFNCIRRSVIILESLSPSQINDRIKNLTMCHRYSILKTGVTSENESSLEWRDRTLNHYSAET